MAKPMDCLECVQTAKKRQQQFDAMVIIAGQQAIRDNEEKVICKKTTTGDYFISNAIDVKKHRYKAIEVVPVVQ